MSIYSVNILSVRLSVMLQKALLLMDVVLLVFIKKLSVLPISNLAAEVAADSAVLSLGDPTLHRYNLFIYLSSFR